MAVLSEGGLGPASELWSKDILLLDYTRIRKGESICHKEPRPPPHKKKKKIYIDTVFL